MGRGKITIKRIENRTTRQVTFAKRRAGLLKKTRELSVLCDAQIALIIFSSSGKMFQFSSEDTCMEDIIKRYQLATGNYIPEHNDQEQMRHELRKMRRDTDTLQLSLKRYTGEDLTSVQFGELLELENQLEYSANRVRTRKFELMQQQMENLKRKGKMLEDENQQIYHLIRENQIALEHHHHQQATIAAKPDEGGRQQELDHFSFFPGEPSTGLLHLGSSVFQPYRLQPAQPNLQDFSLHPPNYEL